ncbi:MAG: ATP-dependent 6-phosphofructokinase [Deltaproteobacteria bacterium]|nr:ATP-dependent 6-phosphofructokinase [Deltaproteobacteria bacterium]
MPTPAQLSVKTLGERKFPSPLNLSTIAGDEIADYVPDRARVLLNTEILEGESPDTSLMFEKAGPREAIHFEPAKTRAAIVTCGGLCPGLNNVIRSMVLEMHHKYRVREVLGFRYGYQGMGTRALPPINLSPDVIRNIHKYGGSILGTSRGAEPVSDMVDTLEKLDVQILFAIGGDGTLKGAHAIHEEIAKRGKHIAVVGVPKTIDNDVCYVDKTFGFDTAVEVARMALDGAHTEAISALNGLGLVKVMGRDSGFIAAAATLASLEVNFCLIPEVHFELEGPNGLYEALKRRLEERRHALIVVAEGCSRALAGANAERDASGNLSYQSADLDIGPRMRDAINKHFKAAGMPVTLKYIDPSYMIRSVPANANDSIFCDILARHAVHAGMAGKTDIVIGRWHDVFTHVPIPLATAQRKAIDPDSALWLAVTETTGQPQLSSIPPSKRGARMPASRSSD